MEREIKREIKLKSYPDIGEKERRVAVSCVDTECILLRFGRSHLAIKWEDLRKAWEAVDKSH